jgi:hypothetical protein
MVYLHAFVLCLQIANVVGSELPRCPAAAVAAVEAGRAERVDPQLLLAIGWRESRWLHRCRTNGANGAWQVVGPRCAEVAELRPAARAGAQALAWWQGRARAQGLAGERAVAAYACGYSGLHGRGCGWYVRDVQRIMRGTK